MCVDASCTALLGGVFRLPLRFRLRPRVEELVVKGWGSVGDFERFVNSQSDRHFLSTRHVKYVADRKADLGPSEVLLAGSLKLVVDEPLRGDPLRLPSIVAVVNSSKDERLEAFGSKPIEESVAFLPSHVDMEAPWDKLARQVRAEKETQQTSPPMPSGRKPNVQVEKTESRRRKRILLPGGVEYYPLNSGSEYEPNKVRVRCSKFNEWLITLPDARYCALCGDEFSAPKCPGCGGRLIPGRGEFCRHCGVKLPADSAVPFDLALELREDLFLRLPQFERELINGAYAVAAAGRDERRVVVGEHVSVIHLQVRDEWVASTLKALTRLKEACEQAGVGRVITDPYELQLIRQRMGLPERGS